MCFRYQKYYKKKQWKRTSGSSLFRLSPWMIVFILLSGILFSIPGRTAAKTTTVMVENNGKITPYTYKGQKVAVDDSVIPTSQLPSIKVNKVWMVSVQEVFQKGLGCEYSYDENSEKLTLTNKETGLSAVLTVNSKKLSVNEKSYTMSQKLLAATNGNSGAQGFLAPAGDLAKRLGYRFSYSGKKLSFYRLTLLSLDTENINYDTTVYQNALYGISMERDSSMTRQSVVMDTLQDTTEETVAVSEDTSHGKITYTFLNTYNLLGDISQNYTSFVKSISVVQEGDNTVVTISYKKQYSYMSSVGNYGAHCNFSSARYSMKISLPEGVAFSAVKTEDRYDKNEFIFSIPGNHKSYYAKNENLLLNNNQIRDVDVAYSGEKTKIVVTTKKIQGFALTEGKGFITVKIANPDKIYKSIVVLDAGHGGKDDGAANRGTKEKALNYKILYTLGKKYFDSKDSEVKVYYTRTEDIFIPLMDRAKFASKVHADLFVSLHMNSCGRSSVNGMEVYYSKENNATAATGLNSRTLAKRMLKKLKNDLNASSRGVKKAGFVVTKYNTVPAILIELGFLSGNSDYSKLTSHTYQDRAARSIYEGISAIFERYSTGR